MLLIDIADIMLDVYDGCFHVCELVAVDVVLGLEIVVFYEEGVEGV